MKFTSALSPLLILCLTFQSFGVVDSIGIESLLTVITGVMGMYDFLKARWDEFVSNSQETKNFIESKNSKLPEDIASIRDALGNLNEDFQFSQSLDQLKDSFSTIYKYYNEIHFQKNSILNETGTIPLGRKKDYQRAAEIVLGEHVRNNPLLNIHLIVRDTFKNYTSYQRNWLQDYQKFANVCVTRLSPLQAVSRLMEHIVWSSGLYYETIMMSNSILDRLGSRARDQGLEHKYANRLDGWYKDTIASIKPALGTMSRRLYNCDLPSISNGELSIEVKSFSKFFLRTCEDFKRPGKLTCPSISQAGDCPGTQDDTVCSIGQSCRGILHSCLPSNDLNVCVSNSSKDARYQYYRLPNELSDFNDYGVCHNRSLKEDQRICITSVSFGSSSTGTICKSCACICEEQDYSINLEPVHPNYTENMVVAAAKFVLKRKVLEVHIKQAKLLPNGQLDVQDYWIGPQKKTLQKISWNEARKILLTRTYLPPGWTMTGLKLSYGQASDPENQGPYIFLQIYASLYNYTIGSLRIREAELVTPWTPPKTQLNVTDFDSPKRGIAKREEFVRNEVWVNLTTSNGKDGGQSTIPFFDGQEVVSDNPIPLSGAGLYYKGGKDYGGYIGIELYTYDTANFIAQVPGAQ